MHERTQDPHVPPVIATPTLSAGGRAWLRGARFAFVARALRRVGGWMLVVLAVVGLYAFISFERGFGQRLSDFERANEQMVSLVAAEFEHELSSLTDDLGVLGGLASLRTYLDEPGESHRQSLNRDFINFAMAKRSYAQVRLLDVAGDEVVRVNFDDGVAVAVDKPDLQSKIARYYVTEAMTMRPGEIYVSALDLNVEHGMVEQPRRPMLRLATTVQDSTGKRAGLLVLNYEAQRLIGWSTEMFADPAHRLLLVNDDGAFILAPEEERNWAFMFPGMLPGDTFAGNFPVSAASLGLREAATVRSGEGVMHIGVFRYPPGLHRASQLVRKWLLVGWTPPPLIARARSDELLGAGWLLLTVATMGALSLLLIGVLAEVFSVYRSAEKESRQRLMSVFESAVDGIVMIDGKGTVEYFNKAAEHIFGWSADEIVGKNVSRLMPQSHAVAHDDYLARYQATGNRLVLGTIRELTGRRKDGGQFPLELSVSEAWIGGQRVFSGFIRDISMRKSFEAQVHHQAVHDELTELPNRRLLLTELDAILEQARARQTMGVLVVVDLDHFMTFNDVMGHLAGDKVLRHIALRLTSRLRQGDMVARLDGDEFAIVLDDLGDDERSVIHLAEVLVEDIREAVREPLSLIDRTYTLTASIGVALYPGEGLDPQNLLKRADIAKNRSKKTGRDAVRFYRPHMEVEIHRRLYVVQDLRRALDNGEFVLFYQPKLDAAANVIAGLEALVRWQHPERGLLPPAEFIEQAEENGLIGELGHWAIGRALADLKQLDDEPGIARVPHVAVNISPAHFYARDFLATLKDLVHASGLPSGRLELEITENLMLDNAELAIGKMQSLRDLGIGIALDDFGTGYSSLRYFQQLPVDRIKIDRTFVRQVDCREDQAAMVRSVLSLAAAKPVHFIAEGVETDAECQWLQAHGCHEIQGFLFSRPLPMDALLAFLRRFCADRQPKAGGAA